MKLVLKEKTPSGGAKPAQWSFEQGSRTIGRSTDCNWQIADDARRVSKQHCTLSYDREGFFITDRSANGTQVDGRLLLEGETARLSDGSQIGIGAQTFDVVISGEAEMDFGDPDRSLRVSDEHMTISAILSDIAPNGRSARGVIAGGMTQDDWADAAPSLTGKKAKSISRNVEVGWNAPPSTAGVGAVLPNDWNEEPVESSKHEHTDAMNIPVLVSRPAKKPPVEDFDAVFMDADEPDDIEPKASVAPMASDPVDDLLLQLEKESAECLAVLDIDPASIGAEPNGASARARLEALIRQQRLLASSLENLIQTCTQKLEPRLVEARADAQNDWRDKLARKEWRSVIARTDYWSTFKQQFEDEGRQLSVRQFLQRAAQGEAEPCDALQTNIKGVSNQDEA
ncbi:FHA domain-containing protein [Agrobacterium vaccinii]|uniref:FHA domain-containing protein n=1 Tax=Agrobacterium vaccinii TaxID=2735528 RepID=UPI001E3BE7BC|nr:FHA domain-containing protein [Agrobacterium vaccinii]UHS64080.1 FHA domain-containing protein [Agrobacterium vaccinii]